MENKIYFEWAHLKRSQTENSVSDAPVVINFFFYS